MPQKNAASPTASSGFPRSRKKRRRKPILGIAPRIFITLVVSSFAVVVFCAFAAKVAQPCQMQHRESQKIHALKTQLSDIDASNAVLERQIAWLQRPDGVATAARAQGYLKPGEVSLVINAKAPPNAPSLDSPGFAGIIERAWRNLTTHH